ncbi:hypothetical protein AAVH_31526 [Aphelenchoides avenae]|nr:hypothetical protein AAVH_31526 [Aphelenchus avenae]
MSLCRGRRKDAHKSAFVKSSALRWIRGDLRFNDSLPRPDYIQQLVEHFRQSSSPESMRRVVFSPSEILLEYASASFHLPGVYVDLFPCPRCTHTEEEEKGSFVEVFHVANVHNPNACATLTFTMPAVLSPRIALHIHTDVFIEALRFLTRSELEKALMVSRRWSSVIGRAEGTLQQRRNFSVLMIKVFYGESSGMLSVYFLRQYSGQCRIHRMLTTRGLSQALYAVHSHLRNVYVGTVLPIFRDSVPSPGPPREVLVDIPLTRRANWLTSLLHSMPRNSEVNHWYVKDVNIGFDSFLPLVPCALQPHRKLSCVRVLELGLMKPDATWAQLASSLCQPSVLGFSEITISTTVAIDTSDLRARDAE